MRQTSFQKTDWDHRFSHGGNLRKKRKGRKERPLSTKEPIHLVFKANAQWIRGGFRTPKRFRRIHQLFDRYSHRFFIKVEQMSIQFDHVHLIVRISRRSNFQTFLRVFAGQVAQCFTKESLVQFEFRTENKNQNVTDTRKQRKVTDTRAKAKLWKHRPFTRVIRGYRAYKIAMDYVRLNELEVQGEIPYRKERLRGVEPHEWQKFWS